jgi:acetyl esterase/lipase
MTTFRSSFRRLAPVAAFVALVSPFGCDKPAPATSPGPGPGVEVSAAPVPPSGQGLPLTEARANFTTKILKRTKQPPPDGPAPAPEGKDFALIRYKSPAGELAAYLSADPGDGKKHPAVVWAHGGFGGISTKKDHFQLSGAAEAFHKAGLVLMCPSWRGENDNPGKFEMFYGEVDDALAAADHVAKLPYVDPKRVYMAGHSTGGTITLLAATAGTDKLRAAFSIGGCPDVMELMLISRGLPYGFQAPFDIMAPEEGPLRSATNFLKGVKSPTFYIEGAGDGDELYCRQAADMQFKARKLGVPFEVFVVPDQDHFTVVEPVAKLLAAKMLADTGPTCNITLTQGELQKQFAPKKADTP